jgi:hypothetical protein
MNENGENSNCGLLNLQDSGDEAVSPSLCFSCLIFRPNLAEVEGDEPLSRSGALMPRFFAMLTRLGGHVQI